MKSDKMSNADMYPEKCLKIGSIKHQKFLRSVSIRYTKKSFFIIFLIKVTITYVFFKKTAIKEYLVKSIKY